MKYFRFIPFLFFVLLLNTQVKAATEPIEDRKTAESVFVFAEEMQSFNKEVFKEELKGLSSSEKIKLIKMSIEDIEQAELAGSGGPTIGYYILAVLLPPAAVGIYTDWSMPTTLYSVGWTLLGFLPGVVHAFIVLGR